MCDSSKVVKSRKVINLLHKVLDPGVDVVVDASSFIFDFRAGVALHELDSHRIFLLLELRDEFGWCRMVARQTAVKGVVEAL
jgi:hypothetical protein